MTPDSVIKTLTEEHREIDRRIEDFAEDVRGGSAEPTALEGVFAALRRHIYLEEEFLFPHMERMGLVMPIAVMQREHGELWRLMDALTETAPCVGSQADAGPQVVSLCADLLALLSQHNDKEEPIVYPQTSAMLDGAELDALGTAMATEGMPDGWTCRTAR